MRISYIENLWFLIGLASVVWIDVKNCAIVLVPAFSLNISVVDFFPGFSVILRRCSLIEMLKLMVKNPIPFVSMNGIIQTIL